MDIIGYPNYTIDRDGNVWSKKNSRFLKQNMGTDGYFTVNLGKYSPRQTIHRLIALHYIPNPDNKPFIDHIDRNRINNAISNLRWVTRSENELNKERGPNLNIQQIGNCFLVKIKRLQVVHYVGCYATIEEARAARDAFIAQFH